MKKLICVIIVVILMGGLKANAQVADTLAYLKNIQANKAQFVGQPFSFLRGSLLVNLAVFLPRAAKFFDMYAETSTIFWVQNPVTATDYATLPRIEVYWNSDLDRHKSDSLWKANNGGYWSARVDSLYGPKIIKDIAVSGE